MTKIIKGKIGSYEEDKQVGMLSPGVKVISGNTIEYDKIIGALEKVNINFSNPLEFWRSNFTCY